MSLSTFWREEADRRFPEFIQQFNETECDTPYLLWFELLDQFVKAYQAPRNADLIRRIYDYAFWCCDQPAGKTVEDDLVTCVSVSFFEHIPETEAALADMPNWFSREDIVGMEKIFSYLVGESGFQRILEQYKK